MEMQRRGNGDLVIDWLLTVLVGLVIYALLFALGGCALAPQQLNDKAVDLVDQWCTRSTQAERDFARTSANAQLAKKGHAICGIKCEGNPPPVVPECKSPAQ